MKTVSVVVINGKSYLHICRPGEPAEDIEISNYEALQIAAALMANIPYGVVKNDPLPLCNKPSEG